MARDQGGFRHRRIVHRAAQLGSGYASSEPGPQGPGAAVDGASTVARQPGDPRAASGLMSVLFYLVGLVRGKERALAYSLAALTVVGGAALAHRAGDKIRSMDEPAFYDVARNLTQGAFAHTNTPGDLLYNSRFPTGALVETAYQTP